MDKLHTLKRMKTTALLPHIADRDDRQVWQEKGSLDTHARAMRRVRDILTRDNPAVFAPDVDARIRAEFESVGLASFKRRTSESEKHLDRSRTICVFKYGNFDFRQSTACTGVCNPDFTVLSRGGIESVVEISC